MLPTKGSAPESRDFGSQGKSRSLITQSISESESDNKQFFVKTVPFRQTMGRSRSALNLGEFA